MTRKSRTATTTINITRERQAISNASIDPIVLSNPKSNIDARSIHFTKNIFGTLSSYNDMEADPEKSMTRIERAKLLFHIFGQLAQIYPHNHLSSILNDRVRAAIDKRSKMSPTNRLNATGIKITDDEVVSMRITNYSLDSAGLIFDISSARQHVSLVLGSRMAYIESVCRMKGLVTAIIKCTRNIRTVTSSSQSQKDKQCWISANVRDRFVSTHTQWLFTYIEQTYVTMEKYYSTAVRRCESVLEKFMQPEQKSFSERARQFVLICIRQLFQYGNLLRVDIIDDTLMYAWESILLDDDIFNNDSNTVLTESDETEFEDYSPVSDDIEEYITTASKSIGMEARATLNLLRESSTKIVEAGSIDNVSADVAKEHCHLMKKLHEEVSISDINILILLSSNMTVTPHMGDDKFLRTDFRIPRSMGFRSINTFGVSDDVGLIFTREDDTVNCEQSNGIRDITFPPIITNLEFIATELPTFDPSRMGVYTKLEITEPRLRTSVMIGESSYVLIGSARSVYKNGYPSIDNTLTSLTFDQPMAIAGDKNSIDESRVVVIVEKSLTITSTQSTRFVGRSFITRKSRFVNMSDANPSVMPIISRPYETISVDVGSNLAANFFIGDEKISVVSSPSRELIMDGRTTTPIGMIENLTSLTGAPIIRTLTDSFFDGKVINYIVATVKRLAESILGLTMRFHDRDNRLRVYRASDIEYLVCSHIISGFFISGRTHDLTFMANGNTRVNSKRMEHDMGVNAIAEGHLPNVFMHMCTSIKKRQLLHLHQFSMLPLVTIKRNDSFGNTYHMELSIPIYNAWNRILIDSRNHSYYTKQFVSSPGVPTSAFTPKVIGHLVITQEIRELFAKVKKEGSGSMSPPMMINGTLLRRDDIEAFGHELAKLMVSDEHSRGYFLINRIAFAYSSVGRCVTQLTFFLLPNASVSLNPHKLVGGLTNP